MQQGNSGPDEKEKYAGKGEGKLFLRGGTPNAKINRVLKDIGEKTVALTGGVRKTSKWERNGSINVEAIKGKRLLGYKAHPLRKEGLEDANWEGNLPLMGGVAVKRQGDEKEKAKDLPDREKEGRF